MAKGDARMYAAVSRIEVILKQAAKQRLYTKFYAPRRAAMPCKYGAKALAACIISHHCLKYALG